MDDVGAPCGRRLPGCGTPDGRIAFWGGQIEETAAKYASLDGAKVAVEALRNPDGSSR
ncbi:hypothetical protein OG223_01680 [Streptomyces sp. NBC_01478]|uniref:hypothetical protein n=1 Tax=Streptomyces sp. NBC_01478 TaxID=2903882 RepID=UPI002E32A41E|nr:hypothetical protein [Streptomyces sp. NBC_01478]